jgi:hypothetical protein
MNSMTDDLQQMLQMATRPTAIPVEMVEDWTRRSHVESDPFPDCITAAPSEEKTAWLAEKRDEVASRVERKAEDVRSLRRKNDTAAQWRDGALRSARNLEDRLHEWQVWHVLSRCAEAGWLAEPLWSLRTERQARRIAQFVGQDLPVDALSFGERPSHDNHYRDWGLRGPKKKDLKTMGIRTRADWDRLAEQIKALPLVRVAVDIGPVPAPHRRGARPKGQKKFWLYRYQTARVDEEGQPTHLKGTSSKQRAKGMSVVDLPPFEGAECKTEMTADNGEEVYG